MLGTSTGSVQIVKYAKAAGIYTVVTDFFPVEKSEAKKYNTEESRLNYLSNQGVSQTLDNLANTFVMVTGYDKNYVEQMIANELSD